MLNPCARNRQSRLPQQARETQISHGCRMLPLIVSGVFWCFLMMGAWFFTFLYYTRCSFIVVVVMLNFLYTWYCFLKQSGGLWWYSVDAVAFEIQHWDIVDHVRPHLVMTSPSKDFSRCLFLCCYVGVQHGFPWGVFEVSTHMCSQHSKSDPHTPWRETLPESHLVGKVLEVWIEL